MSDLAAIAAEVRKLARPHALLRRADVRREALLEIARLLDVAQRPVKPPPPVAVVITGAAPVAVERRRFRRAEKNDPWAELRRVLQDETAEI